MASAELSRRVWKVVGYPPLCKMGDLPRREFHEALLDADRFEDLPGTGCSFEGGAEPAEAASRQRRLSFESGFPAPSVYFARAWRLAARPSNPETGRCWLQARQKR
jgi:hypothetical protein